jgi:hypothetical protein
MLAVISLVLAGEAAMKVIGDRLWKRNCERLPSVAAALLSTELQIFFKAYLAEFRHSFAEDGASDEFVVHAFLSTLLGKKLVRKITDVGGHIWVMNAGGAKRCAMIWNDHISPTAIYDLVQKSSVQEDIYYGVDDLAGRYRAIFPAEAAKTKAFVCLYYGLASADRHSVSDGYLIKDKTLQKVLDPAYAFLAPEKLN